MDRTPMENMPLARYFLHGQKADSVMDGETGIIVACDSRESAELLRDQLNGYEERLDATRAKLAAWQAECARLREALENALPQACDGSGYERGYREDEYGREHEVSEPCAGCCACLPALSRAPGSTDALREVCERVAAEALVAAWPPGWGLNARVNAIVSRILGEKGGEK